MYEIIETDKQVFFMMELAQNGDLLDYINTRRVLKESEAKYLFRQMVSAIQHLHYNKLVHRDLKCENVMLSSKMTVVLGGIINKGCKFRTLKVQLILFRFWVLS